MATNKKQNRIMLDLETMGTGHNAAIVAIGAVRFDETCIIDDFYLSVDLQSSVDAGMTIDPRTVMWWLKQSDDARDELTGEGMLLISALELFESWIGPDAEVWGNGAAFDNVILGNAYRLHGIEQPWKFWNDRCYRTIKSMHPNVPFERSGIHHNAVNDAESQAKHLIRIFNQA